MSGRYLLYFLAGGSLLHLIAFVSAPAAAETFPSCEPQSYSAQSCLKAHQRKARKKNNTVNFVDLGDHAHSAGDHAGAFGHWIRAAENDRDPIAMYRVGSAHYNGNGVPQNDSEAAKWYRQSADLNYAAAQYMLGALYANGQGLDQEKKKAVEWYQKAVAQELPEALHELGSIYYSGADVPQDYVRAAELWRRGAETGHVNSQTNYGFMLFEGHGVVQDYQKAEFWTRKAATAGNAYAKANLGEMYEYGRGVPVDLKQAEKWYREAAAEGIKDAEGGLARIALAAKKAELQAVLDNLASSPGYRAAKALAPVESDGALRNLTDAAADGDFDSQVSLGLIYSGYNSALGETDFDLAKSWMRKAMAQKEKAVAKKLDQQLNVIGAQLRDGKLPGPNIDLAGLLLDPAGAEPEDYYDYRESINWFTMAAELGNTDALIAIGDLYGLGGHGVEQDFAVALQFFERAAKIEVTPLLALRIGSHYAKGLGVEKNYALAAQYYLKIVDQDPNAALWIAKYNILERNLREAIYWLDRSYLDEKDKTSHETDFYKALRNLYGVLLPDLPAGATSIGISHQLTQTPVEAAHLASDDILYPIAFARHYQDPTTGKKFFIRVSLNDFEGAGLILKKVENVRKIAADAKNRLATGAAGSAQKMLRERAAIHFNINGREAFTTTLSSSGEEIVVFAPLKTHILISAQMLDGKGGDAEDIEILKAALRTMDIDLLAASVEGHGYYKKDSKGIVYKPRQGRR